MPDCAMVLAAGLGLRMRPITETMPKPLVPLGGVPLLDRALDRLSEAGVGTAIVNLHYLGHMIEAHLADRTKPAIRFSHEEDALLETGGGVAKALPLLGTAPFFVVNADIAWTDGTVPALQRLEERWDDDAMDALLLLHPVRDATGYGGAGDYSLAEDGCLRRRREETAAPYVFTGVQMLHPRLFDGAPGGKFSMTILYDRAQESGRLFGLVHDGDWHHIGTPAGLAEAEACLAGKKPGGG